MPTPVQTMFAATPSATIGIEALPTCEGHRAYAGDDADGGPDIGEQVLGIGFKSNGVALAPHPQQQQGYDEVHQEASTETARPRPICSSGLGASRRPTAAYPMLTAASRMREPSTPLEKYSALLWP